jgi:putative aldouronate transport system substrate-binding protein
MNDGNIYGFAYLVTASPAQTIPIFVNEKWLEQLDETVPETTDELKKLLIKVRDADLNGNGKADEIPLISNGFSGIVHMFRGSFGIGTRGNTNIDIGPDDKLRYIPITDEYKQLLMYLNDLYKEKLIYQEIFDADLPAVTAVGEQNQVFMGVFNIRDYLGETYKNDFGGVYKPFSSRNLCRKN